MIMKLLMIGVVVVVCVWCGVVLWFVLFVLLVVWEVGVCIGWLLICVLFELVVVVCVVWLFVMLGEMWVNVKVSMWCVLFGFVIGGGVGLVLGFVIGLLKVVEVVFDLMI